MAQDLRTNLDLNKRRKPEDFRIVSKEVDPAHEITAIVAKAEREARQRPGFLFEKVSGTRFPVLTNLPASRGRQTDPLIGYKREGHGLFQSLMAAIRADRVVETGP